MKGIGKYYLALFAAFLAGIHAEPKLHVRMMDSAPVQGKSTIKQDDEERDDCWRRKNGVIRDTTKVRS